MMTALFELLLEPLRYGFIVRGLVPGLLAGVACSFLSFFIVWRQMAFIGDAMSHAILPGIVLSYALGISFVVGAIAAALVTALGIGLVSRRGAIRQDSAIGIIFTALFALGIVLISRMTSYQDLSHILFGNILGVNRGDLWFIAATAAVVTATVLAGFKELILVSFDPSHAIAIGLSPSLIQHGLLILIGCTVVITVRTVGVVLVLALLITPAATASLVARRIRNIVIISIGCTAVATIVGFYLSYYLDLASGATIVLCLSLLFIIAYSIHWTRAAFHRAHPSQDPDASPEVDPAKTVATEAKQDAPLQTDTQH